MALALSKRTISKKIPSDATFSKIAAVAANSLEAPGYVKKRYIDLFVEPKTLEKYERNKASPQPDFWNSLDKSEQAALEPLDNMDQLNDLTAMELQENYDNWNGQQNPNPNKFQNRHESAAKNAISKLKDEAVVIFGFAMNQASQFARKSSIVDPEKISALDKLVNAWMAKNNMVVGPGDTLIKTDAEGVIKRDAKGMPEKVNLDEFKKLIYDPEEGLNAYLGTKAKGIQAVIVEQEYPTKVQPAVEERTVEEAEVQAQSGFKGG